METTPLALAAGVPPMRLDFTYDSQGRRRSKTVIVGTFSGGTLTWHGPVTEYYLYHHWNLVMTYTGTSGSLTPTRSYVWALDLAGMNGGTVGQSAGGVGALLFDFAGTPSSSSTAYVPSYDSNGNITAYTDLAQPLTPVASYAYSPFGKLESALIAPGVGFRFGFSTKFADEETGLLYYGFRYYSPEMGRWLNKDPIEESGGVNLYGFVGNDGVNRWDLLGQQGFGPVPDVVDNFRFPIGPGEDDLGEERWFENHYYHLISAARTKFIAEVNAWVVNHCGESPYSVPLAQAVSPHLEPNSRVPDIWSDKKFGDPGQTDDYMKYRALGRFQLVADTPIQINYTTRSDMLLFEWTTIFRVKDNLGFTPDDNAGAFLSFLAPSKVVTRAKWTLKGVGACCKTKKRD